MPEILDQLRGKYGETIDAMEKQEIAEAFGTDEAVDLIDLLYNKCGDLQGNILTMYDALGSGTGVATEMANAINETEPERFERLAQRIQNVKESIGNSLLPTINDLMSTGEQVLTKVGSWVEENQELVRVIMLVVLAIGGFLTIAGTVIAVVSGVGLIITKVISGFKLLKAGFLLAKGALTPLISSVWSFTAALLANPVTWIVIGIVALIAALVLLYNKCEWFRNAVNAIIDFFKEKLGAALEVASAIFSGIGNVIGSVMNAAKATVSQNLDNMRSAYEAHGGGIRGAAAAAVEGVKGIYTAGFTFLDILCYDIRDLGKQLLPVGMLVVLDSIFNRIIRNRGLKRNTWIYIDEIYLLFQHEYSANFLFTLWKRMRKYQACGTGISQNIEDLLQSHTARTMLANSEFLIMLNQAATDREELARLLNISDNQLSYITNVDSGRGLIKCGSAIVPFVDHFPKNKLYQMMTTKPSDLAS